MPYLYLSHYGQSPLPATHSSKHPSLTENSYLLAVEIELNGRPSERMVFVTVSTSDARVGDFFASCFDVNGTGQIKVKLLTLTDDGEEHELPVEVRAKLVNQDRLNPEYFEFGWEQLEEIFEICQRFDNGDLLLAAREGYKKLCCPRATAEQLSAV